MPYPYQYATVADVQARYDGNYVDRICLDNTTRAPNYDRLNDSLLDATGEMDSYITAVYPVPLAFVPALLKRMCIDMAIYHTALTSDKMTEELSLRYSGWIKHLTMIATRKVGLGIVVGQTGTDATTGAVTTAVVPTEGTGTSSASFGTTIRT